MSKSTHRNRKSTTLALLDLQNQKNQTFQTKKKEILIAIDPGNLSSGICVLEKELQWKIIYAENLPNTFIYATITRFSAHRGPLSIIIEDLRPYGVRLSQQLIDTAKFIGQLDYRLFASGRLPTMITRHEVKQWVYTNTYGAIKTHLEKKIAKLGDVVNQETGETRTRAQSFMYIDDRMVIASMKQVWNIPTPKPGKKNVYGLADHSWQALAVGTAYLYKNKKPA